MSVRLAITADAAEDLALAGLDGAEDEDGVPIRLFRGLGNGGGLLVGRAERRVATEGTSLWRRMPWPVNDALFALPEAHPGDGVAVVGGSPSARAEIAAQLVQAGLRVRAGSRLTAQDLAAAAVVVYAPSAGMQRPGDRLTLAAGPLPVDALAVLAARRLLVAGRCEPAFGLRASLDHLAAGNLDEAVRHALVACHHWDAFGAIRGWAAFMAEHHRASLVLPALAADLALEEELPLSRATVG
jgi:hypothetical protein